MDSAPPLRGLDAPHHQLFSAWRQGRFSHAWIFKGPPQIGKMTYALYWARYLLQHTPQDFWAEPSLEPWDHPDLCILSAFEEDRKNPRILAEDVRFIREFLGRTPALGGRQVVVIDGAEFMNAPAAASLLKVLEEPKAGVFFFLVTSNPSRVLETLRSRSQEMAFAPLDAAAFALEMGEVPEASLLFALTQGRLGYMKSLETQGLIALYHQFCGVVASLSEVYTYRDLFFKKESVLSDQVLKDMVWVFLARFLEYRTGLKPLDAFEAAEQPLFQRLEQALPMEALWEHGLLLSELFRDQHALQLDPQHVFLNTFFYLENFMKGRNFHVS